MEGRPVNLLVERLRRRPVRTQADVCMMAARLAVATFGAVSDERVIDACRAMAKGVFGASFDAATPEQQAAWVDMMERAYRAAL